MTLPTVLERSGTLPAAESRSPHHLPDLEAFLDRFFTRRRAGTGSGANSHYRGALFVLVRGSQVLLQKAYGCAPHGGPFQPEHTLFPVASDTNTFMASAGSMGRLLSALLEAFRPDYAGQVPGRQPAPRPPLYRQQFAQHPDFPDAVYGLYSTRANGQKVLFHLGGQAERSLLYLLPDQNLGFYLMVAASKDQFGTQQGKQAGVGPIAELVQRFLDRYYPITAGLAAAQSWLPRRPGSW